MQEKLHIAVIGGSIGGLTFALGLLQHPHIQFDVFERSTFRERGAGIGVHPNGQNALRELGIDADQLLADAGAFRESCQEAIVAYGDHSGEALMRTPAGVQCVVRVPLLEEMLKRLPAERLHEQKRLVSIDESSGDKLILHFADSTTFSADAVVGSDGIRSTVRGIILGADHPAVPPRDTGHWDGRAILSTEKAMEKFGTGIIQLDNCRESVHCGDGSCILFASAPLDNISGAIVAGKCGPGDEAIEDWKTPITREFLERKYAGWEGTGYLEGVFESLLDPECGPGVIFREWESQSVERYWRGRVVMMGDAAHAAMPWMGQGFSMTCEDSAVLSGVLGRVQERDELELAFKAYDKVRRNGRPAYVQKNARMMADIWCGRQGLDPAKTAEFKQEEKFLHMWEGDIKKEVQDGIRYFEEFKGGR